MRSRHLVILVIISLATFGCVKEKRVAEPTDNTSVVHEPTLTAVQPKATADLEVEIYVLLNDERFKSGLPTLILDQELVKIARFRSQEMASTRYFSHVDQQGESFVNRLDEAGIPYGYTGENIAWNNWPLGESAEEADRTLWKSPGHRKNTLERHYRFVGIGVAESNYGEIFYTIIFNDE